MSDRNLKHLYPPFAAKIEAILAELNAYTAKNMPGHTHWIVVEGLRSAAYQHSLWEQGRTKKGSIVTRCDGFATPSNHQSGLAVDMVPLLESGEIDWEPGEAHWKFLGHCAREHGLHSGGDWTGFVDKPHVEWDPADHATYDQAKAWLKSEGLA